MLLCGSDSSCYQGIGQLPQAQASGVSWCFSRVLQTSQNGEEERATVNAVDFAIPVC